MGALISKYDIFCKVVEYGGFTKAANAISYSQSAVSQTIKNLETELGLTLLSRGKDGIHLTGDGKAMYPYILGIANAEKALYRRQKELQGLNNSDIRIGTFTSVSRNVLPGWMVAFKALYPEVRFILEQGEYTSISEWVRDDIVDFGFVNMLAATDMEGKLLYTDKMCAVLPLDHPLARKEILTLEEIVAEPLILMDEGKFNTPLRAFEREHLSPKIEYEVYDDYTTIAMVEKKLGISIMYRYVLNGYENKVAVRPIDYDLSRPVGMIWNNWDTLPIAARRFIEFIAKQPIA